MKKLLLLGGSHSDIPQIHAAKQLGYHVITSGNRPSEIGHLESDQYECCDFSDIDSVIRLAKQLEIDAICSSCNDFSAISCAYAAKELNLPGHDSPEITETLHHKDKWRRFAESNSIPSPRAIGCSTIDELNYALNTLEFPLIVKPVDLTGGKGIKKVDSYAETIDAAHSAFNASKSNRIVVEEFIIGDKHGFSALIFNKKVVFHFTDDEHYHVSPYLVSGASSRSSCDQHTISNLIHLTELIANELDLVDGIFHVQFIKTPQNDIKIIEICRRPPGDLYVKLVEHSTGAPYPRWIVAAASGIGISDAYHMPVLHNVIRHCVMCTTNGMFLNFNFNPEIKDMIIDQLIWAKKGYMISDYSTQKFGIVFLKFPNYELLKYYEPNLQNLLGVNMQCSV